MHLDNEKIKVGALNPIEVRNKGVGTLITGRRATLLSKYDFCRLNYLSKRLSDVSNYEGCLFIATKLFQKIWEYCHSV